MFYFLVLLLSFNKFEFNLAKTESEDGSDFDENLIESLRDDVNLDLSEDEEYEDLRSELLAYHSALSSLVKTRSKLNNYFYLHTVQKN